MEQFFSELVDKASDYFARRKGLLPLIGAGLVFLNYIVQFLPLGWFGQSNLLLHLGVIVIVIGLLVSWSL